MFIDACWEGIFLLTGVDFSYSQDFGEGFLEDRLKPFFKSDPIPETVSNSI